MRRLTQTDHALSGLPRMPFESSRLRLSRNLATEEENATSCQAEDFRLAFYTIG